MNIGMSSYEQQGTNVNKCISVMNEWMNACLVMTSKEQMPTIVFL